MAWLKYTYKPKDLIQIPALVALALQRDGWYLRSAVTWCKTAPMPESVTDRPTSATEQVFLLAKRESYYYDAQAIAEPVTRGYDGPGGGIQRNTVHGATSHRGLLRSAYSPDGTRNARNWWALNPDPYSGAHFSTMPRELARRCILAGSAARACEHCGAPWERVTAHRPGDAEAHQRPKQTAGMASKTSTLSLSGNGSKEWAERGGLRTTVGWQPTCDCDANTGAASSTVLDPFGGSGTTAATAVGNGRHAIHIDLNPGYLHLARERIGPMFCDDGASPTGPADLVEEVAL